jgi:hypothetical protein
MNKMMMNDDIDIENTGIMQGFMDAMEDDEQDSDEDERSPEELLDRRPDTPEILMNNLRGDMRSIDARRDELADLVGYAAAAETPETVLAMLQPVLAQQGGGGIGALPQSAPMAQGPQPPMMEGMPGMPPPGMPPLPEGAPPMMPGAGMAPPPAQDGGIAALLAGAGGAGGAMPPGMPPSDQPPIQMARGGYVQNFQAGSDEEGVTPVGQAPSENLMMYPPDMVAAARRASMDLFSRQPAATPTLAQATATRLPEYTKMLSADRGASEAQMLFDLGQRAFGFAANVDDSGRPLRGSFMSRLAGATRTLPAAMGKRLDEINRIDRQIKTLALQQGEKDIDKVAAQNNELQKRKGDLLNEVLRAQSRIDAKNAGTKEGGPLGRGSKGDILNSLIQFAPLYQSGALTPEQENTFMTAVTDYTQPSTVEFTDPETGLKSLRTQRNELPKYVRDALKRGGPGTGAPPPVTGAPLPVTGAPAPNFVGATPDNTPPEVFQVASTAPKSSFFDLAATGTGFVPVVVAGVARNVPLDVAGTMAPDFQQSTSMLESMTNRVVNVLQENPRFADAERKQILGELNIAPRLFANKNGYINQIIALDNVVEGLQSRAERVRDEPKTGIAARQEAIKKLEDIASIRELFGIQQRTITDPNVWKTLPPGEYIVVNPQTGFKEVRPKY